MDPAPALFEAIEAHDRRRVAQALGDGADPNAVRDTPPRWRPLHAAVEELEFGGPVDTLVVLIRRGAEVNARDEGDSTPLLMACFRRRLDGVQILLAAGADPDVVGGEGDTPLGWAVEQGDGELASLLLDCGAGKSIDASSGIGGTTPLGHAARRLDLAMVELLLERGADPEAADRDGRRAGELMPAREDGTSDAWDAVARRLEPPSTA